MDVDTCTVCGKQRHMDEVENGICARCEAAWDAFCEEKRTAEDLEAVEGSGFCQCGTPVRSRRLGAQCPDCIRAQRLGVDDYA